MTIWIVRETDKVGGYGSRSVFWYMSKPENHSQLSKPWKSWKAKDFKKEFGFTPRKGTCQERKVELIGIEVITL